MNSGELAQRRQRLQYLSAQQRATIANGIKPLFPVFSTLDRTRDVVHWLRGHPGLSVGALAILGLKRPRKALRWAKRGLFVWQAWRRVSRLLGK